MDLTEKARAAGLPLSLRQACRTLQTPSRAGRVARGRRAGPAVWSREGVVEDVVVAGDGGQCVWGGDRRHSLEHHNLLLVMHLRQRVLQFDPRQQSSLSATKHLAISRCRGTCSFT
eukprot:2689402-Rhodomonas_salina.3